MAGEPECARSLERVRDPLGGRGGELDRVVEERGGVRLHVRRAREPEVEAHGRGGRGVERRFGERAAQEADGALRGAACSRAGGGRPQRRDRRVVGVAVGSQQVQRNALGAGTLVGEHACGVGVPEGAFARAEAAVEGTGDQRVRQRDLRVTVHEAGGPQRVARAGGILCVEPRKACGVAQRRLAPQDRERAGDAGGTGGQS